MVLNDSKTTPANISFTKIPSYSSELNPTEYLFEYMKNKLLHHHQMIISFIMGIQIIL